jgi:iodotyrosine deiodinase
MTEPLPDCVLTAHQPYQTATPLEDVERYRQILSERRSVREFSDRPVPRELIEAIVATATTAPSGANKQPWRFVCVSNPAIKHKIRLAAEAEEREFYAHRAPLEWKRDLAPLCTDENKAFLDVAPWLVVVFRLVKTDAGGTLYYSEESVGIATGMLLAAAQMAGLATLTHTPSPMKFLERVLERPANERAYMLIPMGWAADPCQVPKVASQRRPLNQSLQFVE